MSENNSSKFGLIKKALYIWAVQYHFWIPKEILKGYVHKYHTESDNIAQYGQRFYDPAKEEEYNRWLSFQSYENAPEEMSLVLIGHNLDQVTGTAYMRVNMERLSLSGITAEYVCITGDGCRMYEPFDAYLKYCRDHDVTYFDNDHLDEAGHRSRPCLKPDFSYDTLRGFNYIGHLFIVKKEVLMQFDGQKWDPYRWLLELSDQHASFHHVAKILYGDREEQACEIEVIKEYLKAHAIEAKAETVPDSIAVRLRYALYERPLVSIVIPTKDGMQVLQKCLESIFAKTTYPAYEIIIADNGSVQNETLAYFDLIQSEHQNIHVFACPGPFNFSKINNEAVFEHTQGEYIVLLNNDVSIMTPDWLEQMVSYAQLDHVGSVGVMMYYPDGSIQHGGVITGKGGGFAHRYYRKPGNVKGYLETLAVPNDVACCTAACLMLAKKKYEEVKGMNEELTVQFNDVDLGIKLLEKGYFNVFLPDVKLIHYESKSRGIDKEQSAVQRYVDEVQYAKDHYAKWLIHDPYYNDAFDKNYDYMLIVGNGSN